MRTSNLRMFTLNHDSIRFTIQPNNSIKNFSMGRYVVRLKL